MRRAAQQPLSLGDLEARNPGERLSPDPEHCVRDGGGGGTRMRWDTPRHEHGSLRGGYGALCAG